MTNDTKILIVGASFVMALSVFMIVNIKIIPSEKENKKNAINSVIEKIPEKSALSQEEIVELKAKYRSEFFAVAGEYDSLLTGQKEKSPQKLSELKDRMLSLIIPEDYKKAHLDVVLLFSKMNSLLLDGEKTKIEEAASLLDQAKIKIDSLDKA